MLTDNTRYNLKLATGGVMEVEVNWNQAPSVCESKMLRFHKDGKHFDIEREKLEALLLMVGDSHTAEKLLPLKMTRIRKMERMLYMDFVAKRDYKKGDLIPIKAPWIDILPVEEEVYAGNLAALKPKKSSIIY